MSNETSGINFVEVRGFLEKSEYKPTQSGIPHLTGTIGVPVQFTDRMGNAKSSKAFINIGAWNEYAAYLKDIPVGTFVRVQGSLSSKSYYSPCKSCGVPSKRYWTEVNISALEVCAEQPTYQSTSGGAQ